MVRCESEGACWVGREMRAHPQGHHYDHTLCQCQGNDYYARVSQRSCQKTRTNYTVNRHTVCLMKQTDDILLHLSDFRDFDPLNSTEGLQRQSKIRHNTIRYNTIRHNTITKDQIRHNTIRDYTIQYAMIRYDTM